MKFVEKYQDFSHLINDKTLREVFESEFECICHLTGTDIYILFPYEVENYGYVVDKYRDLALIANNINLFFEHFTNKEKSQLKGDIRGFKLDDAGVSMMLEWVKIAKGKRNSAGRNEQLESIFREIMEVNKQREKSPGGRKGGV